MNSRRPRKRRHSSVQSLASGTRLNEEQIVIEVMEQMLAIGQYELPVCERGQMLGMISFAGIVQFLTDQSDQNLMFHKLNYTMESLLMILKKIKD